MTQWKIWAPWRKKRKEKRTTTIIRENTSRGTFYYLLWVCNRRQVLVRKTVSFDVRMYIIYFSFVCLSRVRETLTTTVNVAIIQDICFSAKTNMKCNVKTALKNKQTKKRTTKKPTSVNSMPIIMYHHHHHHHYYYITIF